MKQLAINVVKNTAIENIVCTPNTVVLAKQTTSTNAKTGEVSTTVRYIEVCPIEKTDPLFIVQSLLKYIVAELKRILRKRISRKGNCLINSLRETRFTAPIPAVKLQTPLFRRFH